MEGASVSIETMEYYSAIRNDKYPPFDSTWMELEGIMLSEITQSEKDKHYMVSFIWGIQKIVKGNKGKRRENEWEISERETEHERLLTLGNEQGVGEGRWAGGGGDWVTGTEGEHLVG